MLPTPIPIMLLFLFPFTSLAMEDSHWQRYDQIMKMKMAQTAEATEELLSR